LLRRSDEAANAGLEVVLYCGRVQLVNKDALYSDGDKYLPAVTAVSHLKTFLPSINSVLVLGSGLGSIVHVIRGKGYNPRYTLVEQNKTILKWAMEFLDEAGEAKVTPVCMDAKAFMEQNTGKYDLVFIDIFNRLSVPEFVTTKEFLQRCKDALSYEGHLALNYITDNKPQWERVKNIVSEIFTGYQVIEEGVNKIIVYTNSKAQSQG